MIQVIAIITAKAGKRDEMLARFLENTVCVREEPGCIEYSPLLDHIDSRKPYGADTFVVVEKWTDESALAAHRASLHMKAYAAERWI